MADLLFVEDDEKIREIFARFLTSKGYGVQLAKDGQEAVDVATQGQFALIIMDVKMPKLDGLSAFQAIHRTCPTIPVILMTGYRANPELEQLSQQGVLVYLHKPVLMKDLELLVQRLLNGEPIHAPAPADETPQTQEAEAAPPQTTNSSGGFSEVSPIEGGHV